MRVLRVLLSTCAVLLLSTAPVAAAPTPDFTFSPTTPTVGQPVTFTPSTTGNSGSRSTASWDFQNDNVPDIRDVPALQQVTYSYLVAGTFNVRMLVRRHDDDDEDDDENVTSVVKAITVNAAPVPQFPVSPTAPVVGQEVPLQSFSPGPDRAVVSLMNPFPVVRLAGSVYPRGVKVRALEAKAPPQSTVTVRCAGKGCPSEEIVKTASKKRVRFKAMTRFLWEGTIISVSIRNSGQIGKYTRWLLRGGKLPKRKDLCLYPSRRKAARCPAA